MTPEETRRIAQAQAALADYNEHTIELMRGGIIPELAVNGLSWDGIPVVSVRFYRTMPASS